MKFEKQSYERKQKAHLQRVVYPPIHTHTCKHTEAKREENLGILSKLIESHFITYM
jgi:hypothetical protein